MKVAKVILVVKSSAFIKDVGRFWPILSLLSHDWNNSSALLIIPIYFRVLPEHTVQHLQKVKSAGDLELECSESERFAGLTTLFPLNSSFGANERHLRVVVNKNTVATVWASAFTVYQHNAFHINKNEPAKKIMGIMENVAIEKQLSQLDIDMSKVNQEGNRI